ncbi:hypothetical protein DFH08DRAFT_939367 [Mycena albidolilacea]|uniref:Uncharacterized protein n=1 Tax=Mycena albidolilacea TaxID=1033008 RepID=A0AAD7EMK5_9AGAR|nr:hypothetical protein DFH08DRAFT_939367 [Mycena albidolilacea]
MCDFCAVVLTAIFHEKVKPAFDAGDPALQSSWENVQKAVVTNVLDFVEQNPSKSNKAAAAEALYPVVSAMFYPRKPVLQWKSPNLVHNANELLIETATDHPENQRKLRSEEVLGPTRMGTVLSQSRDVVVLEAVLGLIGISLPARQTPAKRAEFVDAVFKPELFSRSAEIKKIIAASSGTEWDPVAAQIINIGLAKSDLSFPQPFYISGLRASTSLPEIVDSDPLYVDRNALFANDGVLTSIQVTFLSIERLKIGGPGAPSTSVSIQMNAVPQIGVGVQQQKKCTMQFQLKNADAGRFLQALNVRGQSELISKPKVSKITEDVSLDFNSNEQKPTQQERVAKVERLWQSGRPTSPLVSDPAKTPSRKDAAATSSDLRRDTSSQHESIYGDELSEVSDVEDKPASKVAASKAKPLLPITKMKTKTLPVSSPPRRVRIVEDSDDEQVAPSKTRARQSGMKKRTVESDDDEEEEEEEIKDKDLRSSSPPSSHGKDLDFEPTQELRAAVPARVTRGAAKKNPALAASAGEAEGEPAPGRAKASAAAAAARDEDDGSEDAVAPARSIRRPAARKPVAVDKELLSLSEDEIEEPDAKAPAKTQATAAADTASKKRSNGKADLIKIQAEIASKPAQSKRKPATIDKESSDEIEETDAKPSRATSTADTRSGKADLIKIKAEIATKPAPIKSGRKRRTTDDENVPDSDADDSDRSIKRARGQTVVELEEEETASIPPPPRRPSAAVFGTVTHAPAKKRYGGKKGRTSSPVPDAGDTDMAIDYDELPAAPSPPSPVAEKVVLKEVARQEPKVAASDMNDAPKGRIAAMKGKGGQKPEAKAPPRVVKAVPAGKNKTKTQAAPAVKENADVESDGEAKPRRSTRATNAASKPAGPTVEANIPKPKPKPKPKTKLEKPQKAPWEDMHLHKKEDVAMTDEPLPQNDDVVIQDELHTGSDAFEEYYVPLKAGALLGSIDPPIPEDDVPMLDLTQDTPPKAAGKTVQLEISRAENTTPAPATTSARPLDSTSAFQFDFALAADSPVKSTSAHTFNSASALPAKSTSTLASRAINPAPTKLETVVTDPASPIRPQSRSAVATSEPAIARPVTKFKAQVPSRSMKPVSFLQKVASPSPPPTLPQPLHPKKTPPPAAYQRRTPRSPTPPVYHEVISDSPFPERVHNTTAFAPSRASPPSLKRKGPAILPRRMANSHGL